MPALVIEDNTASDVLWPLTPSGDRAATGLVPRSLSRQAPGYLDAVPRYGAARPLDLIPESEWDARYDEMVATRSSLADIRDAGDGGRPIPSLDQNAADGTPRWGYCWNHGPVQAVMLLRAANNQPYVPLSAFAGASVIKDYQDQGGWGAQGLDFLMKVGAPSQALWPQKQVDRRLDTPAMRANAAKHKVAEGWVDLDSPVYDRNLTFAQVMTLLFRRIPVVADFDWWGHCVVLTAPHRVERGSWGVKGLNSWGDGWGDNGAFVLRGQRAVPNNAVAPAVTTASAD